MRDTHVEFQRLVLECHGDRAASIGRKRLTQLQPHALSADVPAAADASRILGSEPDREIDRISW